MKRTDLERLFSYADPFDFGVTLFEIALPTVERRGIEELSRWERAGFCIYPLDAEVLNGGFDQFFFNPSADYASETLAALEDVGAHRVAELLRQGMALFPSGRPANDHEARQAQMDVFADAEEQVFAELDDQYYELMETPEAPLVKLREYVLLHKDAFNAQ